MMRSFRVFLLALSLAPCTGVLVLSQAQSNNDASEAAKIKNPVPASPESIAAGRQVYQKSCAGCHGETGRGESSHEGTPPASNLTDNRWDRGSSDGEIFDVIKNGGRPKLYMEAWVGRISDTDIWNVVNYIRTLSRVRSAQAGAGARAGASTSVRQNETTVWDGVYTAEQAKRGEAAYGATCGACHMVDLSGGNMAPALAGELFVTRWESRTLSDLFKNIRETMPQDRPASLSAATYGEILAFLLDANQYPAGSQPLKNDVDALREIRIVRKP